MDFQDTINQDQDASVTAPDNADQVCNPESAHCLEKEMTQDLEALECEARSIPDPPSTPINQGNMTQRVQDVQQTDESMLTDESTDLKSLSIAQKKKMVENYKYWELIKEGSFIDAVDSTNSFIMAKVAKIEDIPHKESKQVAVNFDGWSEKWNLVRGLPSRHIAAFRTQHKGYSGQMRIAIRNDMIYKIEDLRLNRALVDKLIASNFENFTANDITQIVRGQIFVYIDFLLGLDLPKEDMTEIEEFFRSILRLIVVWLKKIPTLAQSIDDISQIPNWFLIDPHCAILECYYELMDTLNKLFCNDRRSYRYFCYHDVSQKHSPLISKEIDNLAHSIIKNTFGVVVIDMTERDFVAENLSDDNQFSADLANQRINLRTKNEFGQLSNWVQYFADIGGFNGVINLLSMNLDAEVDTQRLPFIITSQLLKPFRNLNNTLNVEFAKTFSTICKDLVIKRLSQMSDKDVKNCEKSQIDCVLKDLSQLVLIGHSQQESSQLKETTLLNVALRFLKSKYLDKRLKGLQDIREMTEKVAKKERSSKDRKGSEQIGKRQNSIVDTEFEGADKAEFFTAQMMCEWIANNNLIDIIFGEGSHIEIVKRSAQILKLLARYGQGMFDQRIVDTVWRCQVDKHEEMVRNVQDVIVTILPSLSQELIDMFFAKVKETQFYDEKFLQFLKKFTDTALDRRYTQMRGSYLSEVEARQDEDINLEYNYDNFLMVRELDQISKIGQMVQEAQTGDDSHYGLPIFWMICQNTKSNKEISVMALKFMIDILTSDEGHRKTNRVQYLAIGINQLISNENLVPSAKLAREIIDSINKSKDMNHRMMYTNAQPSLIQQIQEQLKITDVLVASLSSYSELVHQKMKVLQEIGHFNEQIFVGGYSHEQTIQTYLDLLAFIVGDTQVQIGIQNIKILWSLFVDQPNYQQEQTLFLQWINRSSTVEHSDSQTEVVEVFTPGEKKFLFAEILCPSAHKMKGNINFSLATCFYNYFKAINIAEGNLQNEHRRMRVVYFQKLQGMTALWNIAMNQNKSETNQCQELLVDLHYKVLNREEAEEIQNIFITKCMQEVQTETGVINLLSMFLDKYEGKQTQIKENTNSNYQYFSQMMKPTKVLVSSWMDQNECVTAQLDVQNHHTLGWIRNWIAERFGLQNNEFSMIIKNQIIDAELNDDTKVQDLTGVFSQISIKRNLQYNPNLHPKFSISNNQTYFDQIFGLLKSTESPSRIESVWNLINMLPHNKARKDNLRTLELIRKAENKSDAWNELFDTSTLFKLLYSLKITDEFTKDENWVNEFITLQGLNHLLNCLINQSITSFNSNLEISGIKQLLSFINAMLNSQEINLSGCNIKALLYRVVQFVDMVCNFSILQEEQRGESYQEIRQRLNSSKIQEDKKIIDSIEKTFLEQSQTISSLFDLNHYLCKIGHYQTCLEVISSYPNLARIISQGLLVSENSMINQAVGHSIQSLLTMTIDGSASFLKTQLLQIELFQVLPIVDKYQTHCQEFFNFICHQIHNIKPSEIEQFQKIAYEKISELAHLIINREIVERTSSDVDYLLKGYMMMLQNLLQLYPIVKQDCGVIMVYHLVHDCLFEIPHGTKGDSGQSAPKCKNIITRRQAFNLLNVLTRDCLENLQTVLQYLNKFSQNPAWRTNKDTDWDVKLYHDEKSLTGHVGIKNLGCICYMNSLNQQLFMIPTFRNDVLSIKDPNHKQDPPEDNMFQQWQTLFSGLLLSQKMFFNPKHYCHAFKDWDGNPTNIVEQMDVEEYLNLFLDRLESAIKNTPQEKTIQYHFGGEYANEIICQTCNYTYDRAEQFLSMSVPVKNKKSIFEGMDAFVQGDMLDGDNKYFCERCNIKVDARKRTCIKKLPRYMIMTLKRFEFDFDQMIRLKVNDYFEFPLELDMSKYTQDYLQKAAKGGELKLEYPSDYYNFELVGVVVHSGTADSGHYYSFIKEQEKFDFEQPEKWYEFNDSFVSYFNSNDIQKQCFGGEETYNYGWHQNKLAITKNAYLLVYKRKLEDFNDEEDAENKEKYAFCGQKSLQVDPESQSYKKVANANHKYWQNRFLFSSECADFVKQMALNWNTNYVIPAQTSWRNNDIHLTDPVFKMFSEQASRPLTISCVKDLKINLVMKYTPEQVLSCQLSVFKFAATFYYTVCQRAYDKAPLQDMVRYLKAYMNYDYQCAKWFLQQFVNFKIFKECFMESPPHPSQAQFMRQIMVGLIYCAMLKVYEQERRDLNNFWADLKQNQLPCRQTTLGNFVLVILTSLPSYIRAFNLNQIEPLQLLYRFSSLGPEARLFLLEAGTVERLLNFFHFEPSPYQKEFMSEQMLPFQINEEPEIGLPTPDGPNAQKSRVTLARESRRINVLYTKTPKYHFLMETLSNLARTMNVGVPTPYMLEDSGFQFSERDLVLFWPSAQFLEKLFVACQKPRAMTALCKAYIHHAWNSEDLIQKLWETIKYGVKEYCGKRSRPFFLMFQFMLQAANDGNQLFCVHLDEWMCEFLQKMIPTNARYYAWMETAIDFLFKFYYRIPMIQQWLSANKEAWEFTSNWVEKNREPPSVDNQSKAKAYVVLSKPDDTPAKRPELRFNKHKNSALYYYRHSMFNLMRQDSTLDLSQEIDFDTLDLSDIKFTAGQSIDIFEQRTVPWVIRGNYTVKTELDECIQYTDNRQQPKEEWVLATRGAVVPDGILMTIYKFREVKRIEDIFIQKSQMEAVQRQKQLQQQQEQQKNNWYQGNHNKNGSDEDEDEEEEEDEMDVDYQKFEEKGYKNDLVAQGVTGSTARPIPQRNDFTQGSQSVETSQPDTSKLQQDDHNNSNEAQANERLSLHDVEFDVNMEQGSDNVDFDSISAEANISD